MHLTGLLAGGGILLAFACSSVPPSPEISPPPKEFSDPLAHAHFEGLAAIGPRWPGEPGDLAAREYLSREFERLGATVRELEEGGRSHLLVEIRGASPDTLLLVTPFQALGSSDWVDDSGPAIFLELVRVMAADPPSYTLVFALAAAEALPGAASKPGWREPSDPLEARRAIFDAGQSLVSELDRQTELEGVRAVVILEPRARRNPRMARDLYSHPVFRKVFWAAADSLGETDAFPPEATWSSPQGLQAAFQGHGLAQVIAVVDETTARVELHAERATGDLPVVRSSGGGDFVPTGLEPVGRVTLEALSRLMHRFERVDAFSP